MDKMINAKQHLDNHKECCPETKDGRLMPSKTISASWMLNNEQDSVKNQTFGNGVHSGCKYTDWLGDIITI